MVISLASIRSILFAIGILALATSLGTMIAAYAHPATSTDYFKQADQFRPYVNWGLGSGFVALILSFFGRRFARWTAVAVAFLLFSYWYGAGMALL